MADNTRNPDEKNDISTDSIHSGTYSFSYPGIQMGLKPLPSTVIKNAPSFRKPVRIIPFMREALKKAGVDEEVKICSAQIHKDVNCEASNVDSLSDMDSVTNLEPMPEMDSFSQNAEHSVGSVKACNEDPNPFRGMGWLMESGKKDRIARQTREQQLENVHESQVSHCAKQPGSSVNHQYSNFTTPQSKNVNHLGVFKEINNSSAVKPRQGIQQSFKTPLKCDSEQNGKIYSASLCYSNSKTLYNPVKSQSSSARKIIIDTKNIVTNSNHNQELNQDLNVRHQMDTPFRFKQVLQEIPFTPGHGCPAKFSHGGPSRHVNNNQDKENDIQQNLIPYENSESQTDEPLNLNIKDLTGHSEHRFESKVNNKINPVQSKHVSHSACPIGVPIISKQLLAEQIPKQPQKEIIKSNVHDISLTLDSSDPISDVPMLPPANSAKPALASESVMFSLPVAKPKNSSLIVNGKPYVIVSQLGTGGSSKVYQVMENGSNVTYAVKCVDLARVDQAIAQGYMNEIALLRKLQHCDSVIRLLGYEYVKKTKTLLVVMEKGDTDFSNFLRDINKTKKISALMIAYYWTEMVTAVDNIHKHGIIHSDLKPPNFLLVAGRLKLIDFGIASSINVDMTSVVKDQLMGTFNYMSPEAIGALNNAGGANSQKRKITFKSDIWSLGCILYNLVYGRTPFAHINGIGKLVEIFNPQHEIKYPDVDYPPVLVEVIKRCLTYDPRLRPSTTDLLQSPLLPKLEDPFLMAKVKSIVTPEMWSLINGNSST